MTERRQRAVIEVTWTCKGTWFITAPCGAGWEYPGYYDFATIRAYCVHHKRTCCTRATRICTEAAQHAQHAYHEMSMT